MTSLYLLQTTAVILAGSTTTSIPMYAVLSMETGNETVVEVVLELADGTEPSVELGSNRRVSVTIITVDICSTPTGERVGNNIFKHKISII